MQQKPELKRFFIHNKQWIIPITIYCTWRLALLLYQITVQHYVTITTEYGDTLWEKLVLSFTQYWDAAAYKQIAESGYTYPQQNFFPLLPILLRAVTFLTHNIYIASHLIQTINGVILSLLFYQASQKLSSISPSRNLIFFLTYPGSIFLIANYAEGILITLILGSIILVEHKKYFLASICIGLASSAKLVGLFANIFIFISTLPTSRKIIYGLIGSSGLILYMAYLQHSTNNPFMFALAQQEWCLPDYPCNFTFPLFTPIIWLLRPHELTAFPALMLDLFYSFAAFIIILFSYKKLALKYLLFSLTILLAWLSTSKIISMTRYLIIAIPLFIVTFEIIKNQKIQNSIMLGNFIIQLIYVGMYSNYMWIG